MTRPTNKQALQILSEQHFQQLFALIHSLSKDEQVSIFPFEDRDRNIRDVLCHLHEWHLMMGNWYKIGMAGNKPKTPAEGYTWKTLPELNKMIWQQYQTTDLSEAITLLEQSHQQVMQLINQHSNDELFTKKYYPWTGSTSLGAYFVSSTSSHYDWAIKKIKKYKRSLMNK